jgi:hypothetical protein
MQGTLLEAHGSSAGIGQGETLNAALETVIPLGDEVSWWQC